MLPDSRPKGFMVPELRLMDETLILISIHGWTPYIKNSRELAFLELQMSLGSEVGMVPNVDLTLTRSFSNNQ